MYILSQLFIYPVKSLAGFEVSSAPLCERGLHYDRRWMLIDAGNNFLTQRNYPVMSLLQTDIDNDKLVIYHKHDIADTISVDLDPAPAATFKVNIWNDECEAQGTSDVADKWFSDKLSVACRLVYMPETSRRKVDPVYARKNEITGFSDAYPLMMVGQASLDDLNSRLLVRVPMNRFRPNIVFTGGKAYDEDLMEQIVINGIHLYGVKLCARCSIPTIDQSSGVKGKEPISTLAGYRTAGNNIYLGQNFLLGSTGEIKNGDIIDVIKTGEPIIFNAPKRTVLLGGG